MSTALKSRPMPKRKDAARRTNDVTVKMDAEVVRKAKIVAAFNDQSLAEFLSDTLGAIVDRLMAEAYAKESQASRSAKGKGRGGDKPQ